jgi:hypothetical protein
MTEDCPGGTEGSNPSSSTGESLANLISKVSAGALRMRKTLRRLAQQQAKIAAGDAGSRRGG